MKRYVCNFANSPLQLKYRKAFPVAIAFTIVRPTVKGRQFRLRPAAKCGQPNQIKKCKHEYNADTCKARAREKIPAAQQLRWWKADKVWTALAFSFGRVTVCAVNKAVTIKTGSLALNRRYPEVLAPTSSNSRLPAIDHRLVTLTFAAAMTAAVSVERSWTSGVFYWMQFWQFWLRFWLQCCLLFWSVSFFRNPLCGFFPALQRHIKDTVAEELMWETKITKSLCAEQQRCVTDTSFTKT